MCLEVFDDILHLAAELHFHLAEVPKTVVNRIERDTPNERECSCSPVNMKVSFAKCKCQTDKKIAHHSAFFHFYLLSERNSNFHAFEILPASTSMVRFKAIAENMIAFNVSNNVKTRKLLEQNSTI